MHKKAAYFHFLAQNSALKAFSSQNKIGKTSIVSQGKCLDMGLLLLSLILFPLFISETNTATKTITTNAKTPIIIIPLLQSTKGRTNSFISERFYLGRKISNVLKLEI